MVKRRATRKANRRTTVEGLHASFGRIDDKVRAMIAKGATDSALMECIRKEWTRQFHMDISAPAVKGMVMHYRVVHPGSKRKTRKQKGGMAPLDWTMGQGTTEHVYGRFPVEMGTSPQVIRSLDLGRFYESRTGRICDSTGGHAAPGQMGGGIFDAMLMGKAPASVPHNMVETAVSTVQGAPIANPLASPVSAYIQGSTFAPTPYDAGSISHISSLAPVYKPT
jgi:hypothetical protein